MNETAKECQLEGVATSGFPAVFSLTFTLLVVEAKYEESIKYFDEFEYCLIVITWCVSINWPEKYPMSVSVPGVTQL